MTAWLIYSKKSAAYNKQYINYYIEEGKRLAIKLQLIIAERLEFGIEQNTWFLRYDSQKVSEPDFVICRFIYPLLSRQLEYMGIPVFNNSFVAEICNDKAKTCQYLARTGINMISSSFYKNSQLSEILQHTALPTVIKAVDGHGGTQVFLTGIKKAGDYDKLQEIADFAAPDSEIVKGINHSDLIVQPLTGKTHQDLRVYVIGRKIIAAVLRTATGSFKSNFSLGGKVCLYQLSQKEQEIVHHILKEFDFGLVGIDFIIGDNGELIFNEIEDVVGSRMLYQCSDINIVYLYLEFILQRLTGQT